jgi:phosphoribosylformylglycinamidine (FGAM) synthase PurS component
LSGEEQFVVAGKLRFREVDFGKLVQLYLDDRDEEAIDKEMNRIK